MGLFVSNFVIITQPLNGNIMKWILKRLELNAEMMFYMPFSTIWDYLLSIWIRMSMIITCHNVCYKNEMEIEWNEY